ncbi:hypothetical protein C8R47DRAFT_1075232 [Mycena vitilis]|nr:hypothetical protein C8R47DRAFT_1075232 [Mycena vitilis]
MSRVTEEMLDLNPKRIGSAEIGCDVTQAKKKRLRSGGIARGTRSNGVYPKLHAGKRVYLSEKESSAWTKNGMTKATSPGSESNTQTSGLVPTAIAERTMRRRALLMVQMRLFHCGGLQRGAEWLAAWDRQKDVTREVEVWNALGMRTGPCAARRRERSSNDLPPASIVHHRKMGGERDYGGRRPEGKEFGGGDKRAAAAMKTQADLHYENLSLSQRCVTQWLEADDAGNIPSRVGFAESQRNGCHGPRTEALTAEERQAGRDARPHLRARITRKRPVAKKKATWAKAREAEVMM